jgi:hypothetical protein
MILITMHIKNSDIGPCNVNHSLLSLRASKPQRAQKGGGGLTTVDLVYDLDWPNVKIKKVPAQLQPVKKP